MNTVILYHDDLDGIFSAYPFLQKYPSAIHQAMQHGVPVDLSFIEPDDFVILVDYCLASIEEMINLYNLVNGKFIWIDHHKTSIESMASAEINIPGVREVGKAASQLVWEYLNPNIEMPFALKAVSQMDIWDKTGELDWNEQVMPFITGLPKYLKLTDELVGKLFEDSIDLITEILETGNINLEEIKRQNAAIMNRYAFEFEWEGLRFIAVNRLGSSTMFDSKYDPNKHDAMMCFVRQANNWKFTMYTDKDIDLSEIAKKFPGGGGHKQACGMNCKKLPFDI